MDLVIQCERLGMRYSGGPEVLRDISFRVSRGAFQFIKGPSGAGKSSLLRMLMLAHRPSRGVLRLFGQDPVRLSRTEQARMRRRIGVVFQDFRLLDHLTVADNVALPLHLAGGKPEQYREHVRDMLRWVGLGHKLDALPSTLSGGEQQRAAIARAVINRPDLLMADEPTANVDEQSARRLVHLFGELNRLGTTVIVATHSDAIVRRFDSAVLYMEGGQLFDAAPPVTRIA